MKVSRNSRGSWSRDRVTRPATALQAPTMRQHQLPRCRPALAPSVHNVAVPPHQASIMRPSRHHGSLVHTITSTQLPRCRQRTKPRKIEPMRFSTGRRRSGASAAAQLLSSEDLDTADSPLATAQHEPTSVQQVVTCRRGVRGCRGIEPDVVDVRPSLGEGAPRR